MIQLKRWLKRIPGVEQARIFVYSRQYVHGASYDNEKYWSDKLQKYGDASLKGVGNPSWTDEQNRTDYDAGREVVDGFFRAGKIAFTGSMKALEVGCGSGYWTEFFQQQGIKHLTAVDVTDVLFERLRTRFPNVHFMKHNIIHPFPDAGFDFISVIDVLQHIKAADEFKTALCNLDAVLKPSGLLLITVGGTARNSFYTQHRPLSEYRSVFTDWRFIVEPIPFRDKEIMVLQKP